MAHWKILGYGYNFVRFDNPELSFSLEKKVQRLEGSWEEYLYSFLKESLVPGEMPVLKFKFRKPLSLRRNNQNRLV